MGQTNQNVQEKRLFWLGPRKHRLQRMHNMLSVLFLLLPAFFIAGELYAGGALRKAIPRCPAIPAEIQGQDRVDLLQLQQECREKSARLLSRAASQTQACSAVPRASSEYKQCQLERESVLTEADEYEQMVKSLDGKIAMAQARAALEKQKNAAKSGTTEGTHRQASECYDSPCVPIQSGTVDLSHVSMRPKVSAWVANNPAYKNLDQEMTSLETSLKAVNARILDAQQKRASGAGDRNALVMQETKLKAERSTIEGQMAKKRQEMVDLSVQLEQQGPPEREGSPQGGRH